MTVGKKKRKTRVCGGDGWMGLRGMQCVFGKGRESVALRMMKGKTGVTFYSANNELTTVFLVRNVSP